MIKTRHRYHEYDFPWSNYVNLVIAVYRQAAKDAKRGDPKAIEFIQEVASKPNPAAWKPKQRRVRQCATR